MKQKIDGKTVLITGASSGIGEELARQLAAKNCRLVLVARREDKLRHLSDSLPASSGPHCYFRCDVGDYNQVKDCCEKFLNQNVLPDVLILNAGFSKKFDARSFDVSQVKQIFDVNFWGVLHFLEFLLPPMIERNSGHIVFMASLAGYRGMPKAAPYSASKAALGIFLESLRIDLFGTDLKLTLLSPGFIETPLTTQRDFRMPFIMPLPNAVQKIIKGIERAQPEVHFPKMLSWPAKLGRCLPYKAYARLMAQQRK